MCLVSALQNKGHIRSSRHCCPEVQNWILYYIVVIPPPKREQNSSSYCSCGFSAVFTAGSCIYIFVGRTLTNLEQVVQIWPFLSLVHCSLLCTHHTCASEEAATTICLVFSLGGCGILLIDLCIILAKTLFVLLLTGRPWWPQFG